MPILLSTGFAKSVDETVAVEAGLSGLTLKPYNVQKVAEVVRQALEVRAAEAS